MLSAGLFPCLQTQMHVLLAQSHPPVLWRGGLYGLSQARVEYLVTLMEVGRAIDVWVRSSHCPAPGSVTSGARLCCEAV